MALATGQKEQVQAMEEILQQGGSAIDSLVAGIVSLAASFPIFGGLTAVGYMVVDSPEGTQVIDFMGQHPFKSRDRPEPITVCVDMGQVQQPFQFGPSTVCPSSLLKLLIDLHDKWGKLEWSQLFQPTIRNLREGIEITEFRHTVLTIFNQVLKAFPSFNEIYGGEDGQIKNVGDKFYNPRLLQFLERLAENKDHRLLAEAYEGIGLEFEEIDYEVKEPLHFQFRGHDIYTVPPPNSGGLMLAYTFKKLDEQLQQGDDKRQRIRKVIDILKDAWDTRISRVFGNLNRPDIVESLLGNTEQFSVVDHDGLSISCTISNGACNAVFCPVTGVMFNNILGEPDLNPKGFLQDEPGTKFPSVMAPCLVKHQGNLKYIVGSSGSERIRSALVSVLLGLLEDGLSLQEAVEKGRIHYDGSKAHLEDESDETLQEITEIPLAFWDASQIYFGGCHCIEKQDNQFIARGDRRRDGGESII